MPRYGIRKKFAGQIFMMLFNCAVFMERNNKPDEAKNYLQQSLDAYGNKLAWRMKKDYQDDHCGDQ